MCVFTTYTNMQDDAGLMSKTQAAQFAEREGWKCDVFNLHDCTLSTVQAASFCALPSPCVAMLAVLKGCGPDVSLISLLCCSEDIV